MPYSDETIRNILPIGKQHLVKMDERDLRILLAMLSNLDSFLKDAHAKAKNIQGLPTINFTYSTVRE